MTSPAIDMTCTTCFDVQASRHRLEVELARVIRERDDLRAEVRQLRHERGRDDHLTFAGGTLGVADAV